MCSVLSDPLFQIQPYEKAQRIHLNITQGILVDLCLLTESQPLKLHVWVEKKKKSSFYKNSEVKGVSSNSWHIIALSRQPAFKRSKHPFKAQIWGTTPGIFYNTGWACAGFAGPAASHSCTSPLLTHCCTSAHCCLCTWQPLRVIFERHLGPCSVGSKHGAWGRPGR